MRVLIGLLLFFLLFPFVCGLFLSGLSLALVLIVSGFTLGILFKFKLAVGILTFFVFLFVGVLLFLIAGGFLVVLI